MKILIVSQYAPPENVPIPGSIAKAMSARGHQVKILTGFPNYPHGKIMTGYRQKWSFRESLDGLEIVRTPLYINHSSSAIKRMLNYLSFAASSVLRRKYARDADVIYVYATQMTAAFGPWIWSFFRGGKPYVLHIQDIWPESISGSDLVQGSFASRAIERLLNPWIRSVYRRASSLVAISPSMKTFLSDRVDDPEKISVLYNWTDGNHPQSSRGSAETSASEKFNLIYAGNIGDMQDLPTVVNAVGSLAQDNISLTLVGDGVAKSSLEQLVRDNNWDNITFLPPRPASDMGELYKDAHAAIVSLRDLPIFGHTVPSKLQGYCAYGLPIVSTVPGAVEAIIKSRSIGRTSPPENAASLAKAILQLSRTPHEKYVEMRKRCQQTHQELFDSTMALNRLEEIFQLAQKVKDQ